MCLNIKSIVLVLSLAGSTLLTMALGSTTPTLRGSIQTERLAPADLHYRGAFRYPAGDEWAYSGHALAYYPGGDADGAADGYPGSLYAVGHAWYQQVGEITIPAPVITDNLAVLPVATLLQGPGDITGGWINNCTNDEGCEYREVGGLAYLDNLDKIAWNLRDWYNADGGDQDSLGWSERNFSNAQGVWHIGSRADPAFHNARTSDYLFKAPLDFAEQHLAGKWLIAGNTRHAGALGGSQGPTLYATAPWQDGNPPTAGQDLAAVDLLYYPTAEGCIENQGAQCHFPNYRAHDDWGGGAWIEVGGKHAVVIMGRKGVGNNCYGIPGEDCQPSLCTTDKGWHSDPYEPQLLFYDPAELAQVAAGKRDPWSVLPYTIYRPVSELMQPDCGILNAVAYDTARHLLYATESGAGTNGETVVHVWEVQVEANPQTPTPEPTSEPTAASTRPVVPTVIPATPFFLPIIQQ